MQAEPHFSWLRELVAPVFFTLFGASLGYIATLIRDERKAKRDKEAFLRAVGMELDALGKQLDASLQEVTGSKERVEAGGKTGPQIAAALRTIVFTSQLGKLRDVDDPVLIEVIHFYSDLAMLERIIEGVNETGIEYTRAPVPSGEKDSIRPRLLSTLRVLQEQLAGFGARLRKLRAKLPPAETPGERA
jgi:predicted metal-dependent TIM-barrel fold hydrolase